MTEDELEALVAEHGAVTSANIITDKYSGRSRGFGFVEMEDDAAAEAAIEALNETEHLELIKLSLEKTGTSSLSNIC